MRIGRKFFFTAFMTVELVVIWEELVIGFVDILHSIGFHVWFLS